MKKYLLASLLVAFITTTSFSQSTEIKPGLVLPQMTTAQRTALASPINGTLVFDSNTQSYWYRQSGAWVELPKGGSTNNYWQLNGLGGNEIKNTNSGGFWSSNPTGLSNNANSSTNPPVAPVNGPGTRMMWIPSRSAFRAGTVSDGYQSWDAANIGLFSTAFGINTEASGPSSTAMGYVTTASGPSSTAMGYVTTASGPSSTAMGKGTSASGDVSTAAGFGTSASGNYAIAMGFNSKASGNNSTAMGRYVDTNYQTGTFLIGDSDPLNKGDLSAGVPDQFAARFRNGYYLLTSGSGFTGRTGLFAGVGANSWSSISDSTKKENFLAASGENVLKSVAAMRVGTWNYKGDDRPEGRHWGVMAQDFYHHFGTDKYGTIGSDTLIATADFDGVSFAAIKALEERSSKQLLEIETLKKRLLEMDALKMKVVIFEEKITKLTALIEQKIIDKVTISKSVTDR